MYSDTIMAYTEEPCGALRTWGPRGGLPVAVWGIYMG
jgi:hypothetical protein